MFVELLYPLGLLAALGIGIPIAIHTWQVHKQRVLRVGSVSVVAHAKKQRLQKLRIKNWLLLVVRCIIILLLAALLAGPYLNTNKTPGAAPGWVLLGAGHHSLLDDTQRQLIDSLLANDYTVHAFEPGFRQLSIPNNGDTVASISNQFALIHQLNERLPADFPVTVFSRPEITQLVGDIPTTPLKLNWHAFTKEDTAHVARFITHAWKTSSDSLAVLVGTSDSQGTRFERLTIKGNGREEGVQLDVDKGQIRVKFPRQHEWITVIDKPLAVQFAVDGHPIDAEYVKAVLVAFEQQTGWRVTIDTYNPATPCDILFDFTDAGVTDTADAPKTVFRYMPGEAMPQQGNHLVQWGTATNAENPEIHQLVVAENDTAAVVWADAYGRPVLTRDHDGNGWRYRFYCRFNPQWTDMVWSEAMVNNLVPLLLNPDVPLGSQRFEAHAMDRQALGGTIPLQHRLKTSQETYGEPEQPTMTSLLTWLTLLTFAIERIMTHRQKKARTDG